MRKGISSYVCGLFPPLAQALSQTVEMWGTEAFRVAQELCPILLLETDRVLKVGKVLSELDVLF